MNALNDFVQHAMLWELNAADKNVTKETLANRVLEKFLRVLDKKEGDLEFALRSASGVVYVHPQVSSFLSRHLPVDHPAFDEDERLLVRKIFSADRHLEREAFEFCDLLDRSRLEPALRRRILEAFAVDGFRGACLRDYQFGLSFALHDDSDAVADREKPDWMRAVETHVKAVRHLYRSNASLDSEKIGEVVRHAVRQAESDSRDIRDGVKQYVEFVGARLDDIKTWIELEYLGVEANVSTV